MLERKKILDDNAKLKAEGDNARREALQWIEARDAVKGELSAHLGLVGNTKALGEVVATNLKAQKESLQAEIGTLESTTVTRRGTLTGIETSIDEKSKEVATLEARNTELKKDISTKEGWYASTHKDNSNAIDKKTAELTAIEKQVVAAKAELAQVEKDTQARTAGVLVMETAVSVRSRDLAIYEARIRKAASELDPPMEIVLQ